MIKPATLADLDQIVALHLDALSSTPNSVIGTWLIRKLYRQTMRFDATKIFVYRENQQILGLISLSFDTPKIIRLLSTGFSLSELGRIMGALLLHPRSLLEQVKHKLFMLAVSQYLPPHYASILTLAVDSRARRKKIGSSLMAHIEKITPSGTDSIYVDTYTHNVRAIHFYLKNGYHPVASSFGSTLLKKDL